MTDLSTKPAIRRACLARRDLIEPGEAHAAAKVIAREGLSLIRRLVPVCGTIGAYWPIRSEISTRPLLETLAKAGYRVALPATVAAAKPLRFHLWSPGDDLHVGPLGLAEPSGDAPVATPDALFVPLAAFDGSGHRIGYGGGNFDATLDGLRKGRPLPAIGLAFALQEVAAVPAEPHDQKLDYVITEEKTFSFGANG
ncbi:MAG: 5-formyltetrahydrofolate cyclo-ligase [Beijerinckiaceae bacterium]